MTDHNWIFVNEAFPAWYRDHLVLTKEGVVVVGWAAQDYGWHETWGGSPIIGAVAWQPLPAIPEQYRRDE